MTNLLVDSLDVRNYLTQLVQVVRAEKSRVQELAPAGARVSCIIEHSVTFTSTGPVEKAQIKYGLSHFSEGKMLPPTYEVKELIDGENYNGSVINDLIQAAADDCNMAIDMFAMNADVMYSDDISSRIQNFVSASLQSIGIDDGFTVTSIPVTGGISQITIMVS
jgi:hypothetical protein